MKILKVTVIVIQIIAFLGCAKYEPIGISNDFDKSLPEEIKKPLINFDIPANCKSTKIDYLDIGKVIQLSKTCAPEVLISSLSVQESELQIQRLDDEKVPSLYLYPNLNVPLFKKSSFKDTLSTNLRIYWNILSLIRKDYTHYYSEMNYKNDIYEFESNIQRAQINALELYFNYLKSKDLLDLANKKKELSLKRYEDLLYLKKYKITTKQEVDKAQVEKDFEIKRYDELDFQKKKNYQSLLKLLQLDKKTTIKEYAIKNIPELAETSVVVNKILKNSPLMKAAGYRFDIMKEAEKLAQWKRWTNFNLYLTNSFSLDNDDITNAYKEINLTATWNLPLYKRREQSRIIQSSKINMSKAYINKKETRSQILENINNLISNYKKTKLKQKDIKLKLEILTDEKKFLVENVSLGRASKWQVHQINFEINKNVIALKIINYDLIFNRASIDILCGDDPQLWL